MLPIHAGNFIMFTPHINRGAKVGCAVIGTLGRHLPNRSKRIIFLASLAERFKEAILLDNDVIRGINNLFNLAKSDAVLEFPYDLGKFIWSGKTREDICQTSFKDGNLYPLGVARIIRCIMVAIPNWLRYGPDREIEQDIEILLENRTATLGFVS